MNNECEINRSREVSIRIVQLTIFEASKLGLDIWRYWNGSFDKFDVLLVVALTRKKNGTALQTALQTGCIVRDAPGQWLMSISVWHWLDRCANFWPDNAVVNFLENNFASAEYQLDLFIGFPSIYCTICHFAIWKQHLGTAHEWQIRWRLNNVGEEEENKLWNQSRPARSLWVATKYAIQSSCSTIFTFLFLVGSPIRCSITNFWQ